MSRAGQVPPACEIDDCEPGPAELAVNLLAASIVAVALLPAVLAVRVIRDLAR